MLLALEDILKELQTLKMGLIQKIVTSNDSSLIKGRRICYVLGCELMSNKRTSYSSW